MSKRGRMTARVIESSFPNYRQLLPDEYPNRLTIKRDALLEAVGRASLVAEDHIPVRLSLGSGGVELSVTRQDVGGETEYIEAEYDGEDMMIAFNTRYLTDGVAAMKSENLVLETINPLKPGLLTAADDRGLPLPADAGSVVGVRTSVHLAWLELNQFRSYESSSVRARPGINVLIGRNGAGKTNVLEAIGYLSMLKSFRRTPDALDDSRAEPSKPSSGGDSDDVENPPLISPSRFQRPDDARCW